MLRTIAEADTPPAVEQEMTFSVTGLNAKASSVYVAVFESEAGFPNSELSSNTRVISATEDQVRFSLDAADRISHSRSPFFRTSMETENCPKMGSVSPRSRTVFRTTPAVCWDHQRSVRQCLP